MAFDVGSVTAKITADISDFKKGVDQAKHEANTLGDKIQGVALGLGKVALAAGAAAAAVGVVFAKQSIDAAAQAESEMAKVDALLKTTGKDFKELREEVDKTSKSFIKLGFDDEETAIAMAKSLAVTKDATESKKELALAADFARLQDIGIVEAQKLLQLAYMGNARVLKQYGIELEDGATKQDIFAKIQEKAGGQADAYAQTFKGSMAIFNVEFENLKESVGVKLLPLATQFIKTLTSFLTPIMDVISGTKSLGEAFNLNGEQTKQLENILNGFKSFLFDTLVPAVQAVAIALTTFWKDHQVQIEAIWMVIWGIIQVVWGLIYGLISVGLELLAGDWDGAWKAIQQSTETVWSGIKSILTGGLQFISDWGGDVYNKLTQPFADAWNRIQELVNKIKDKLDFTKRHSPSVVDIVKKGVGEVNKALSGLDVILPQVNPQVAQTRPMGNGGIIANIAVNLDGAIISDDITASRMSEKIGDSIIRKLNSNIRY